MRAGAILGLVPCPIFSPRLCDIPPYGNQRTQADGCASSTISDAFGMFHRPISVVYLCRSSAALGSVASAASLAAALQVGALRLRERTSAGNALHFDSTAEPVNLTNRSSGRPSAAAELPC
jgi:hypothetical protein